MNPSPTTVLFLSTGNAARGLMAEGLLREKGEGRFAAMSAGYAPLPAPAPEVKQLLTQAGIPARGLAPKNWTGIFEAPQSIFVDVIVTLSEEARLYCPRWPADPVRVHWPVDDPLAATDADQRDWKFRKCFDILQSRVDALIKQRTPRSQMELMLQLRSISAMV